MYKKVAFAIINSRSLNFLSAKTTVLNKTKALTFLEPRSSIEVRKSLLANAIIAFVDYCFVLAKISQDGEAGTLNCICNLCYK